MENIFGISENLPLLELLSLFLSLKLLSEFLSRFYSFFSSWWWVRFDLTIIVQRPNSYLRNSGLCLARARTFYCTQMRLGTAVFSKQSFACLITPRKYPCWQERARVILLRVIYNRSCGTCALNSISRKRSSREGERRKTTAEKNVWYL